MVIIIGGCKYQLEAQISNDLNMALRVFRYGFEESLRSRSFADGEITLPFPQVRVIYWETSRKTPDTLTVNLVFPDGTRHKYEVEAFKFLDHSIAELEERNMSILLPFYVLKLRKQVKAARTGKRRLELSKEMEGIIDKLEATVRRSAGAGVLDEEDTLMVLNDLNQLYQELYNGYNEFRRTDEMRFEKYEHPIEGLKRELKRKAIRQGQREGRREEQREIALKLKADGLSAEKIAAYTGLSPEKIEKL